MYQVLRDWNVDSLPTTAYCMHKATYTDLCAKPLIKPLPRAVLGVPLRWGADKSLSRPTFQCRRTESIVLLERGVCSCAELQVFSCYRGWKKACQATRAISTTSRRELSSSSPPHKARRQGNSRHSGRNIRGKCIIVCHRQKLGGPV